MGSSPDRLPGPGRLGAPKDSRESPWLSCLGTRPRGRLCPEHPHPHPRQEAEAAGGTAEAAPRPEGRFSDCGQQEALTQETGADPPQPRRGPLEAARAGPLRV